MIYDLTTAEAMRLANIKRWGIVEMSRSQSVTEHTCNVAFIGMSLAEIYDRVAGERGIRQLNDQEHRDLMRLCLTHDLPEIYSGDVPTPLKRAIGKEAIKKWEAERFPKLKQLEINASELTKLIKSMADGVEALNYCDRWCVDKRRSAIIADLREGITAIMAVDNNPFIPIPMLNALEQALLEVMRELDMHGGMN